jgi:hypothetical protein
MKIKEGFLMREVGGKPVVIPGGKAAKDFAGMIKLNSTGKYIWEAIDSGKSKEEIAESMVADYGITREKAQQDLDKFIATMKEEGFLEE